jgi:tryptophan synthase alpha chain
MTRATELSDAIRRPKHPGRPAVMPYLTSGYPSCEGFTELLLGVAELADAIEVGVPFSDPMADGPVIQRSSRLALDEGVTLRWILETVRTLPRRPSAPLVLMSYLNPLLAYGLDRVVDDAYDAGFSGFIVPDFPWEESGAFRAKVASRGMAPVQLVTPVTPDERLRTLTAGEGGFVYVVTVTGTTGAAIDTATVNRFLDRVRAMTTKPVVAGFGIRGPEHVRALAGHADGAIVGTALIDALGKGEDGVAFVRALVEG